MENKIYGRVYMITNLVNGKRYIGQTINSINQRFNQHIYDSKHRKDMIICRAIKKYGKENFKIEEIAVAYTQKQLDFSEGFYINSFNTLTPNGYNITDIINGKGKMSKNTKQKISKAAKTSKRFKINSKNGKNCRGKPKTNSTSKYCGVSKKRNKYLACLRFNNKSIHIGHYNNEEDAAKAYDIAALKYYGNNAILNFPELRQDYINGKIKINKNTFQDYSKSGVSGITFHKQSNKWRYVWRNESNKIKTKSFLILEEAIQYRLAHLNVLKSLHKSAS